MRLSLGWVFAALVAAAGPTHAAWHEAKSKHFIIYADENPNALQTFATKLEKFDKAVRMARTMDDPPIGDAGRVAIYVLRDTDSVSRVAVGKSSPIAGFYIPRASAPSPSCRAGEPATRSGTSAPTRCSSTNMRIT